MTKQQRLLQLFGNPTKGQRSADYTMYIPDKTILNAWAWFPRRIYMNRMLKTPFDNALKNLIARGIASELKTFDGCQNVRPIRGAEKRYSELIARGKESEAVNLLSMHAWAVAIDVNASTNRLGAKPTLSTEFVSCFVQAGFDWGGNFTRKDGMHFELSNRMIGNV